MADIVMLETLTTLDIPADRVLEKHLGQLQEVVLVGIDHQGELVTASSMGDLRLAHFRLLEAARRIERMNDGTS